MAKEKIVYYCTECGTTHPRWSGKCPDCGAWNAMEERTVNKKHRKVKIDNKSRPRPIQDAKKKPLTRIKTKINEFDRVLGGGFVKGSVLLLGGEPGVGKSTLMLQVLDKILDKNILEIFNSSEIKNFLAQNYAQETFSTFKLKNVKKDKWVDISKEKVNF